MYKESERKTLAKNKIIKKFKKENPFLNTEMVSLASVSQGSISGIRNLLTQGISPGSRSKHQSTIKRCGF